VTRIIGVSLDSSTIAARAPDVEVERHRVISDLLHDNSFRLKGTEGPYTLALSLGGDRLIIEILCGKTGHREAISLVLAAFRRQIQDYALICDSFYKTARAGEMHRLEAIDMGRRAMHDEAALLLAEALEDKVILDKPTARRLFSLVYVLHARNMV
jgi:uncharacterized protein (UPF0262 family)